MIKAQDIVSLFDNYLAETPSEQFLEDVRQFSPGLLEPSEPVEADKVSKQSAKAKSVKIYHSRKVSRPKTDLAPKY